MTDNLDHIHVPNIKEIWDDVPAEEMTLKDKAIKDSFLCLCAAWGQLECVKHAKEIKCLKRNHLWVKMVGVAGGLVLLYEAFEKFKLFLKG